MFRGILCNVGICQEWWGLWIEKRGEVVRLYELSTAYNGVMQQLEDADESSLQCLTDTLDSISASIEVKVQGISQMIKMVSDTSAVDKEIERLQGMKKVAQGKERWLKGYLQGQMEFLKITEVKTELFKVNLQDNPGAVDIHSIPAKYKKKTILIEPDKKAILEQLRAGRKVKGAVLMTSKRVVIR